MASFAENNVFTNKHAWRCILALLISIILWLLVHLISDMIGGLFRRRRRGHVSEIPAREYGSNHITNVNTTTTDAVPATNWHGRSERVREALHVVSFLLATSIFFNLFVNEITKGFEILVWILLALGVLWALGRGLVKRFAAILLLLILPLFVVMMALGMRRATYGQRL